MEFWTNVSSEISPDSVFELKIDLIKNKITNKNYWSNSIWMEMIATEFFDTNLNDHTYSEQNNIKKNVSNVINKQNFEEIQILNTCEKTFNKSECLHYNRNVDCIKFDIQNCIEIKRNQKINNKNGNDTAEEKSCSGIEENEVKINKNLRYSYSDSPTSYSNDEHQDRFTSYTTDDSGIESSNSFFTENENSLVKSTVSVQKITKCIKETLVDECFTELLVNKDVLMKNYYNKRKPRKLGSTNKEFVSKIEREPISEVSDKVTMKYIEISKDSNEASKKKYIGSRKSREVFISEQSPIIEGEFEHSRRVTRLLVKNNVPIHAKTIKNTPGKLVWGYFRTGWWPAIIIKAEDAGMISTIGKIWVAWIGESRISELHAKNLESFSSNLELRLNNLATDSKIKVTSKKQRDDACFKTIQLLKKHFTSSALVRPYISWIKNNILPQKNKLDELLFYPYPESLTEKLNSLKKINFEKNEKYLRQQEKERLSKTIEMKTSIKRVEKPEKPVEEGGINIMDQKPGMIVWAKMQGYSLWPCVIMNYQHLNRKQPHVAHQWVMWYGDYKYSEVEYRQILMFPIGMKKMETKIQASKEDLFSKAVIQASKDFCEKLGYLTEPWKLNDIIHLFYKSKDRFKLKNIELNEPNDDDIYSQTIKKQLRKQINNQPVSEERKRRILNCKNLKLVLSRKLCLDALCITCFESNEVLEEHPFFYASMCNKCLEEFRPKVFAYGNDSKCFYCTLCGGEDLVAMCDSMNCPRVFCTACIKYIICPDFYEEILLKHPWYCFLCDPNSLSFKESVMKIREDWRKRMISIYRLHCDDKTASNLERFDRNKKIRVLSLFDGIGTGLLVLKNLNVDVECYYASEIDPDSIQVTFFNHGHEVVQLGDIRNIDEKKIKEICPIDLLIGGSPCNELSLANPKRRGLDDPEGTGILFYDYCRIKKLVKKYNKKRHLFWLFENVASMPKKFRSQISENLGREPKFLDSADFSAQHRPRLYWGNLPWGPYQANDVILQDVLWKKCNRQALVKKIMTVTTRTNSLNQTKENLKPVLMDGKKDMLWVTELERIFGFPVHYTDANLQKTRRLQLIGKAWSVQTLTAILRPVFYF